MHTSRSGKQLEDQIHIMLDKVLHDEDVREDYVVHFMDEDEHSFLEAGLNKKSQHLSNEPKTNKYRSNRHLEDLNYINNISTTLSCHSASATTSSVDYCKRNRNHSLNLNDDEVINIEQGIENLI
jgi:hypothetical protein